MKILKKIFNKKNNWVLLPMLSGLLLFLSYPPQNLWFLVFVALVPLFWFLFSEKTSAKQAFFGGTINGFIFMGGTYLWLFSTAPFDWAGASNQKEFWLALLLMIVLWLFQIILLALFSGLFFWLIKKIVNKNPTLLSSLMFIPCSWTIFEYLRAWWFEFIWLGKETWFGPHWTFGNIAYALHKMDLLIQSADIWGVYGIGFLIVLINTAIFLIIKNFEEKLKQKKRIIFTGLVILMVFSFLIIYGSLKIKNTETGPERKIALLQTEFLSNSSFNAYHSKEAFSTVLGLFKDPETKTQNPDFVIMPEGMSIVLSVGDEKIAKHLIGDFWKPGQIYLESKKIIDENGKFKERLFYYDMEKENPFGYYEKKLLVPNGDFLPYITKFIISIYTQKSNLEERLYQKGKTSAPIQTPKGNIGGTICSSVVSPQEIRQITKNGAEIITVSTSDAPFHKSKSLNEQKFAMSKFRAIENRRYIAQSTNMGYSFVLNSRGEIVIKSQNFGNRIIFAKVELLNKKTPYTKNGDWFILMVFVILILKLSYPQARKFLLQTKK